MVTDNGLEVLVHIGLDTVSLEGKPFEVKVTEGQTVAAGDLLVEADLDAIREAGLKLQQLLSSQMQMRLNLLRSNILVNWQQMLQLQQ